MINRRVYRRRWQGTRFYRLHGDWMLLRLLHGFRDFILLQRDRLLQTHLHRRSCIEIEVVRIR